MGMQKRLLEEYEEQRSVAEYIAIEAGVLSVCELHDEIYAPGNDIEDAYRYGNSKFTKGDLACRFEDRKELTDVIKDVVTDCPDKCSRCARIMDQ